MEKQIKLASLQRYLSTSEAIGFKLAAHLKHRNIITWQDLHKADALALIIDIKKQQGFGNRSIALVLMAKRLAAKVVKGDCVAYEAIANKKVSGKLGLLAVIKRFIKIKFLKQPRRA